MSDVSFNGHWPTKILFEIDADVIIANGNTNFFFGVIRDMKIGNIRICFIFQYDFP